MERNAIDLTTNYKEIIKETSDCINHRDMEGAIMTIGKGLQADPNNYRLYCALGEVYHSFKHYNLAYLCYEHAAYTGRSSSDAATLLEHKRIYYNIYDVHVNNINIVIRASNGLMNLKHCIESIRKFNSNLIYNITVIDSTTQADIVKWVDRQVNIKHITNSAEEGPAYTYNQALHASDNNHDILLLEDTSILMHNSLFCMRMALYSSDRVAATGPVTNVAIGGQHTHAHCSTLAEFYSYAYHRNIPFCHLYERRNMLMSFTMLIKCKALRKTGYFDNTYEYGSCIEDYCMRLISNDYDLLLCHNSFVYHSVPLMFKEDSTKLHNVITFTNNHLFTKTGIDLESIGKTASPIVSLINSDRSAPLKFLEVGCDCGANLLNIEYNYRNSTVYGIERLIQKALLCSHMFQTLCSVVEDCDPGKFGTLFDYIIIDTVFCKLENPLEIVDRLSLFLNDNGRLLLSIDNSTHYSLLLPKYATNIYLNRRRYSKYEIAEMFMNNNYVFINSTPIKTNVTPEIRKDIYKFCTDNDINADTLDYDVSRYLISIRKNDVTG